MPDSFSSMSTRWQVWSVVPTLIIVGGLGFAVLADAKSVIGWRFEKYSRRGTVQFPHSRMRLSGTSWLVLCTTTGLLLWGRLRIFHSGSARIAGEHDPR